MRRSFWVRSGGRSGGGMLRTVKRVSRSGLGGLQQDPTGSSPSAGDRPPTPTNKRGLNISSSAAQSPTSSASSSLNLSRSGPNSPAAVTGSGRGWPVLNPSFVDEFEWECLEDEGASADGHGVSDGSVFGSPPSVHEVEDAILSLQQVVGPEFRRGGTTSDPDEDVPNQNFSPAASTGNASSRNSGLDWIEPPYQWRLVQPCGINVVYDAFSLLDTDPLVQRMVVSLSSDRAVWDAVLDNEAVRELRDLLDRADETGLHSSVESQNPPPTTASGVLSWIFENMKSKFMVVVVNFTKLLSDLFQGHREKEHDDAFMEKLKASFMLTVIVMFVVVVGRASSG